MHHNMYSKYILTYLFIHLFIQAEYAKDNQMEQSDVGCFINKCGDQTKQLFSNPRGIKGVSCLGRCKGEQSCATRCFAEFGSEDLDNWLSCTIEENECVKVPKNVDNSAENLGYTTAIKKFDPSTLVGKWYKTDGLNPNYDLFDCQTNTFKFTDDKQQELDMGIFFRVPRPDEYGGGFWENSLTEHMVVDAKMPEVPNPTGRTMHTAGKMYGLKFTENWYIIGESNGEKDIPPFKLVAYKGHTLQGNYEGAFVYSKESILPSAAVPAVKDAAAKAGLDFDKFTRIDNTCSTASKSLNDASAGTGTSTTDWVDLVVGEGGVIDWISPGKSAFVLFCLVLLCVQYEDSMIWLLHLAFFSLHLTAFTPHALTYVTIISLSTSYIVITRIFQVGEESTRSSCKLASIYSILDRKPRMCDILGIIMIIKAESADKSTFSRVTTIYLPLDHSRLFIFFLSSRRAMSY